MKQSNKFTLARFIFAPVFFFIYNIPVWTESSILAKISAFIMIPLLIFFEYTDYLDGHYARKHGEVSDFGKLFDPFADVILNLTVFACAMTSFQSEVKAYMPLVIFMFILYREFSQSFLRMIATKNGVTIAARKGGKLKTVFYIISGFFALTAESALRLGFNITEILPVVRIISVILFSICLVLSYASFIDYIRHFSKILKTDDL